MSQPPWSLPTADASARSAAADLGGAVAEPDGTAAVALRRLRWQARRGMLENDLLLGRFFDRHGANLDAAAMAAVVRLLDLPDGELLDLALGLSEPQGALDEPSVRATLELLRAA
jgi:antitoxin CptB